MNIVLMEHDTDCEIAAIATATQKSYDTVESASGWRKLPFGAENPLFGNPYALYLALLWLGFWKKNVTLTMLLEGKAEPMKTIVLIHDPKSPLLNQHWCVWAGISEIGNHILYDGRKNSPRLLAPERFIEFFRRGAPNCAFTVYKANIFSIIINRIKLFFRGDKQ